MCHVLIIEDDWIIADHIAQLVETAGAMSIDMAVTEDEAVTHALARPPAVIVSDVSLAAGTGPSAVARIIAQLGRIPVGAVEKCAAGTRYGWGRNDTPRLSDPVSHGIECREDGARHGVCVDKLSGVLHDRQTDTAPDPARAPPPLPEEEEKMMSTSISEVSFGRTAPGICVRDIHAAHDFYSRILGFRKVFENGDPVGFMVLKKDQAEIHLSRKSDHHASTANVMHMFVSDAAALYSIC